MKYYVAFFLFLQLPLYIFSIQQNIIGTTSAGVPITAYSWGKGEKSLVFLFSFSRTEEEKLKILKDLEEKTTEVSIEKKINVLFLPQETTGICWQRNFPENHLPVTYYYTKLINCGEIPGISDTSNILIRFFQNNTTEGKTIVFQIENGIQNVYIGSFSSSTKDIAVLLQKQQNIMILPELQTAGSLTLWLDKQRKTPMFVIPDTVFEKFSSSCFDTLFKTDFLGKLFKNNESENSYFRQLVLQTLPEECKISKNQEENFFQLLHESCDNPELVLLPNKKHSLSENYRPDDMILIDGKNLSFKRGIQMRQCTLEALLAMRSAAMQDKCCLQVVSAFRSYYTQKDVFMHWVREFGRKEAERISALPGTSQHQLGTAIDFNLLDETFAEHPEGKWLAAHAVEYGFILSFPKDMEHITGYRYEPWHYRYVGKDTALIIQNYFHGNLELFLQWFWSLWQPLT